VHLIVLSWTRLSLGLRGLGKHSHATQDVTRVPFKLEELRVELTVALRGNHSQVVNRDCRRLGRRDCLMRLGLELFLALLIGQKLQKGKLLIGVIFSWNSVDVTLIEGAAACHHGVTVWTLQVDRCRTHHSLVVVESVLEVIIKG
jgi:hypothetical protein